MPTVVTPPESVDAVATSATHAAEREVCEARDKEVKALQAWTKKDGIALAEIQIAVKPHLLDLVVGFQTTAEAWDCLKVLLEDSTTTRRDDLEEDLETLRMKPGETIMKNVGRAKGLCNDLAVAEVTVKEHSLVLRTLRGLPAGYSTMRTVVKSKDGPHSLPAATAMLLGAEKDLEADGDVDVPLAFLAHLARLKEDGDGRPGRREIREDKKLQCYYYKRPGRKNADCHKRKENEKKKGGDGKGGQEGRGADRPQGP